MTLSEYKKIFKRFFQALGALLTSLTVFTFATALLHTELVSPDPTYLIYDKNGNYIDEYAPGENQNFGYWPLEEMPDKAVKATLAVEDHRFYDHPGIDPIAMVRAFFQNLKKGERVSGASTIAMQTARMQSPKKRTYWRKAVESVTALLMTLRYGRNAVLEHYLRIAPYGNRIRGIRYASRIYFDKPAKDLSWAEAAFLCALPQSPGKMNPYHADGRLKAISRGKRILGLLLDHNRMSKDEYITAMKQMDFIHPRPENNRPVSMMHAVLRMEEILSDKAVREKLDNGRLLRTTLDLDMQREIDALVYRFMQDRGIPGGAGNAAAIVLERESNRLVSYVGSTDYFDDRFAGAIDYARIPRSSGSALKPFIYALALEKNIINPNSILDDLRRGAGGVTNADGKYLGPLLPRKALANSRNVPAVNILNRIGIENVYGFFQEIGLTGGILPAEYYGLGMAIGGLSVTLENLVRAYSVLAGDGCLSEFKWIEGLPPVSTKRIFSEKTVRLIALFLSDPMARLPCFPRMGSLEYPFAAAVKTGTSSGFHDVWAVAYSKDYLTGVWIGHPDFRPMKRLTGYNSAAVLVKEIMSFLHRNQMDGLQDSAFEPPENYHSIRICSFSGKPAGNACQNTVMEWLPSGDDPGESCDSHVRLPVNKLTDEICLDVIDPENTEFRAFTLIEPKYADWATDSGLPCLPKYFYNFLKKSKLNTRPENRQFARKLPSSVKIKIMEPDDGMRIYSDPETPEALSTVALRAVVDPPAQQVVWYVDDSPFLTAEYPYTVRWPLKPGEHNFKVKLPYGGQASRPVTIWVD